MINKFIIYGIPRVGSNYFISQLNLHPNILCHFEVFHKNAIYFGFDNKINTINISIEERDKNPNKFLELLWMKDCEMNSIGYNIFPNQNQSVLEESMQKTEIKKIILKRKNILKNFVSLKIAKKTGSWSKHVKSSKDKKILFCENEFIRYINSVNKFYNNLENNISLNNNECLVVYYEDFLANKQKVLNEVFKFIGEYEYELPKNDKFGKQNPEELKELIINYKDYKDFLKRGFVTF